LVVARFLGFVAGPYALAVPIASVRRILAADHDHADDAAAGRPHALAAVLGVGPRGPAQAVLVFDADDGGWSVSCCGLRGVVETERLLTLPATLARDHPELLVGAIADGDELALVVDPLALVALLPRDHGAAAPAMGSRVAATPDPGRGSGVTS
jgi:hypothetical protein